MKRDAEIDRVLNELNAWCSAEYGRKAELGKLLGVTRQQVYDWTVKRRLPNLVMWGRLQAFLKTQRGHKPGAPAAGKKPAKAKAKR